jgi:DNA (cytosine-5)-methyltransferase 1
VNVGSLFSGCGGLDLGIVQLGAQVVWHAEIEPAPSRVLERHWPDVANLGDITQVDWADVEQIDMLVGGFPCQDISYAGKGAGLDGDRSGLWFVMADAVRVLRPRHVLLENVAGLTTRGLGRVLYDLAEAGYVGSWRCIRAADVGAPHRRERIFIAATDAERLGGAGRRETGHLASAPRDRQGEGDQRQRDGDAVDDRRATSAYARCGRREGRRSAARIGEPLPREPQPMAWGAYEPAIRRWEHVLGIPAPRPTDIRGRLMPEFVEWMMGFPIGWTDGESRTARLRMLGNAVVPQVAAVAASVFASSQAVAA